MIRDLTDLKQDGLYAMDYRYVTKEESLVHTATGWRSIGNMVQFCPPAGDGE